MAWGGGGQSNKVEQLLQLFLCPLMVSHSMAIGCVGVSMKSSRVLYVNMSFSNTTSTVMMIAIRRVMMLPPCMCLAPYRQDLAHVINGVSKIRG